MSAASPQGTQVPQVPPTQQAQQPVARADPTHMALTRAVDDVERLINVYLSRIDAAFFTPYDVEDALKDWEAALLSVDSLEKAFTAHGAMWLSLSDTTGGANEVQQRAIGSKTAAEAEVQKIAAAAAAAATSFSSASNAALPVPGSAVAATATVAAATPTSTQTDNLRTVINRAA